MRTWRPQTKHAVWYHPPSSVPGSSPCLSVRLDPVRGPRVGGMLFLWCLTDREATTGTAWVTGSTGSSPTTAAAAATTATTYSTGGTSVEGCTLFDTERSSPLESMGERRKAKRQVKLRADDDAAEVQQPTEELEFRRFGYAEFVEDPGIVRGLLVSLHQRVAAMNVNLSAKLEELHTEQDTCSQLRAIRLQLTELARTVESCQGEVADIKKDVVAIKCDIEQLQATKEEIEELRDCVERLEEQHRRRRLRLLEQGLTCHLAFAIFTSVLGMFQFGYNTGVINAPQSTLQDFIVTVWYNRYNEEISEGVRKFLWSVAVSIFAIGGMVGGFLGGALANRFGRKRGLLLAGVIGIIGASFMATCKLLKTFELLIIGRFIIGVNCGLYTSLSPMYVSELAPINLRGGLGTVNQLAVTIGLLLSQILGLDMILGTEHGWNILLGLAICPPALQMLLLLFCPESPRYLLLTKGWEESARAALIKLRNCGNVEDDIEEMRAEDRLQQEDLRVTMFEMLRTPHLRVPLLIAVVIQLSQQLSGINAVLYYSTNLFITANLSDESARLATIGVGAVMVFMTIASIPMMDRAGRRTLMLYGLGGMFIFSIFITISLLVKIMVDGMAYLSIASILCFVMFFSVGPGSIPWMITAELFSQGPRPSAISIATLVNWTANFVVGIGFLPMKKAFEDYTFLPFTGLLAIFWIFTYQKVPETKNKTFEEISAIFRRHNPNMLNSIHGSAKLCQLRENSSLIGETSNPSPNYLANAPVQNPPDDNKKDELANSNV